MIIELTKDELNDLYSCVSVRIKTLNQNMFNNGRIKKLKDLEDKLFNWLSLPDNYNINNKT